MPKYARVDWDRIRSELLAGKGVAELAEKYGVVAQTISNKASKERWELGKTKAAILAEVAEGKAKEIEVVVEEIGARLKGASLRTRVRMAEQVEAVLEELEGVAGMNVLTKSRCLASLAQTAEKVHRWSGEATGEGMERLKTAAINMRLIKTSPEQLRSLAKAKRGVVAGEAGCVGGQSQEAAG
jgi:hypothetical protein